MTTTNTKKNPSTNHVAVAVLLVVSSSVLFLLPPAVVVNGFVSTTIRHRNLRQLSPTESLLDVPKTCSKSTIPFRCKNKGVGKVQATSRDNANDKDNEEDWLQVRRKEYVDLLDRIHSVIEDEANQMKSEIVELDELEKEINNKDNDAELLPGLVEALKQVQDEYNQIQYKLTPPDGLSMKDYKSTIRLLLRLPPPIRLGLVYALEYYDTETDYDKNSIAGDVVRVPEIVSKLYEERITLTPKKLSDAYKRATTTSAIATTTSRSVTPANTNPANTSSKTATNAKAKNDNDSFTKGFLDGFADATKEIEETSQLDNTINQLLPRVTRKKESDENKIPYYTPTQEDADKLMNVLLESSSSSQPFIPNGRPEKIPGGYLIRGRIKNYKLTGTECITAIDQKLASSVGKNWNCTVSLLPDITDLDSVSISGTDDNDGNDKILLLLSKDFTPATNVNFFRLATVLAIISSTLFAIGVYGSNDMFSTQLTNALSQASSSSSIVQGGGFEKTGIVDADNVFLALNLFFQNVGAILVPLLVITVVHDLGHSFIAKREKIETSETTLLPLLGSLPILAPFKSLRTSPRNLTALFDFAFVGPLFGFIASFAFLVYGLVQTQSILAANVVVASSGSGDVDGAAQAAAATAKSAVQLLPALPVSFVKMSTLGATIVESFTGGYISLMEDPKTPIPLHPYAIAGFCGMLCNALEMLPLGSTDGGRISMSIFGRQGQSIVGGATWLVIIVSSFFVLDERGDTILAAWLVFNVVQNDMEIPAKDETDKVDVARCVAAFLLWFLSLLVFIPMS